MNEVERHSVTGYGRQDINYNDPEGEFVYYEDYTALQQQLTATTNSLTNAQEALKSAGIEADTVQAGVMEMVDKLAELEKQDPVEYQYYYHNHGTGTGQWLPITNKHTFERMKSEHAGDNDFSFRELFARPAPAIDLNAVRAEGLDMAAAEIDRWFGCGSLAREIRQKSAQLRAGNAGKDGSHE